VQGPRKFCLSCIFSIRPTTSTRAWGRGWLQERVFCYPRHGIKISNRRATQRCNVSSFFYAKICSLLARRRSSQPVQRAYWPDNVIDWLGKWRPTCVMRHARGQKLQSFRRKWPFCYRSLFCAQGRSPNPAFKMWVKKQISTPQASFNIGFSSCHIWTNIGKCWGCGIVSIVPQHLFWRCTVLHLLNSSPGSTIHKSIRVGGVEVESLACEVGSQNA
jgi:hypothetical protein